MPLCHARLLYPSLLSALFRVTLVALFSNPVPPGSVSQGLGLQVCSQAQLPSAFSSLPSSAVLVYSHLLFGAQDI